MEVPFSKDLDCVKFQIVGAEYFFMPNKKSHHYWRDFFLLEIVLC